MRIKEEIFLKYYDKEDLPLMRYYNDRKDFEEKYGINNIYKEEDFEVPEIFQRWFDLNYSHLLYRR